MNIQRSMFEHVWTYFQKDSYKVFYKPLALRCVVGSLSFSKKMSFNFLKKSLYRQLCLIWTIVDPKFLSVLCEIRIMRIGIIYIGRNWHFQSVWLRQKFGLHMS